MRKKIVLSLLIFVMIFVITGCGEENSKKVENKKSIVGYYQAFDAVQYGIDFTEEEVKSENITLVIREDNTATLKWGDSEGKDYKIDGNRFIALSGDEEGKITYKNGVLKIELADGDYLSFKK